GPLDSDQQSRGVVLGKRILSAAGYPKSVRVSSRIACLVSKRKASLTRRHVSLSRGQKLTASEQLVVDVLLDRRPDPGIEHEGFAGRHSSGSFELRDRDVVCGRSLKRAVVDRDAARRRPPCRVCRVLSCPS